MEVELRRLAWLQQHLVELGNASPARVGDEPIISSLSRFSLMTFIPCYNYTLRVISLALLSN